MTQKLSVSLKLVMETTPVRKISQIRQKGFTVVFLGGLLFCAFALHQKKELQTVSVLLQLVISTNVMIIKLLSVIGF